MRVKIKQYSILVILAIFASCTSTDVYEQETISNKYVSLTYDFDKLETRSIATDDENKIEEADVFFFESHADKNKQMYVAHAKAESIQGSVLKLLLPSTIKPNVNYKVLVLANTSTYIDNLEATLSDVGANKNFTYSVFYDEIFASTDKQILTPQVLPYSGKLVNLAGEETDFSITNQLNNNTPNFIIRFTRSVARIDFVNLSNKLQVEWVKIANYRSRGFLFHCNMPIGDVIPGTTSIDPTKEDPGQYVFVDDSQKLKNELYTFANFVIPSTPDDYETTCLIIAGKYLDDDQLSYYRANISDNVKFQALKSNHYYTLTVTNVTSRGKIDDDTALHKGTEVNLELDVVEWSTIDDEVVIEDNQDNYLAFDPSTVLEFSRDRETKSIQIRTNHTDGFEIVDYSYEDDLGEWIQTNLPEHKKVGHNEEPFNLEVTVEENSFSTGRTGYIHVQAGRMEVKLEIYQGTDNKVHITLLDNNTDQNEITELLFTAPIGVLPEAQSFVVNWFPFTEALTVTNMQLGPNEFYSDDAPKTGDLITSADGNKLISITPSTVISQEDITTDPLYEKQNLLNFKLNSSEFNLNKSILLKQRALYIDVETDSENDYLTDGELYDFKVNCNTGWEIVDIQGDKTLLSEKSRLDLIGVNGEAVDDGKKVSFRTTNQETKSGILTVVFKYTDERYSNITVSVDLKINRALISGWAGSNIYVTQDANDEYIMTFDDVGDKTHEDYQGVYFKWGSLFGLDSKTASINKVAGSMIFDPRTAKWQDFSDSKLEKYNSIPFIEDLPGPIGVDSYALEGLTDASKGIGDICVYLTEKGWAPRSKEGQKWRMPTASQFGTLDNHIFDDFMGKEENLSQLVDKSDGSYIIKSGRPTSDMIKTFFPFSGFRSDSGGGLSAVGLYGFYWTGSATGDSRAYFTELYSDYINPSGVEDPRKALPIRCITVDDK